MRTSIRFYVLIATPVHALKLMVSKAARSTGVLGDVLLISGAFVGYLYLGSLLIAAQIQGV